MPKSKLYSDWKRFPVEDWRWPDFSPKEIACRDGSLMIDFEAMDKLQALREAMGRPFVVNSAYRSPAYNEHVGGAARSRHMIGLAFDIDMSGHDPHEFEVMAQHYGFNGIGRYPDKGFLHIDARPTEEAATWGPSFPGEPPQAAFVPAPPAPLPDAAEAATADAPRKVGFRRGGAFVRFLKGGNA